MQALSTDVEIEVKCHKNYSHRVIFQIALLSIWPLNLDICIQTKGASELQTYFGDNLCCQKLDIWVGSENCRAATPNNHCYAKNGSVMPSHRPPFFSP